jgi:hypothetical protein
MSNLTSEPAPKVGVRGPRSILNLNRFAVTAEFHDHSGRL